MASTWQKYPLRHAPLKIVSDAVLKVQIIFTLTSLNVFLNAKPIRVQLYMAPQAVSKKQMMYHGNVT